MKLKKEIMAKLTKKYIFYINEKIFNILDGVYEDYVIETGSEETGKGYLEELIADIINESYEKLEIKK